MVCLQSHFDFFLGRKVGDIMKTPLDTLQGTVISGLVILVVMVFVVQAIGG